MAAAPSTELAPYEPPAEMETVAFQPAGRDIVDGWTGILGNVAYLANEIADTEFVPKVLRGKPAAITACLLTGRELGLGPMASLKHVILVDGNPSLSAEYKRARVLERGHEYEILKLDKIRCVIRGRRRGQQRWTEFEYTIQDAKDARLVRPGGAWVTVRKRMLLARASSDMCDAIFSDCVNGLPTAELVSEGYVLGESGERGAEMAELDGGAVAEASKPVQRRQRKQRAAAPEPELDGEVPEDDPELLDEDWDDPEEAELDGEADDDWPGDEEAVHAEPMITDPQLKRIQAQSRALRLNDEQRHRAASQITGRDIASYNDLTEEEASAVMDVFSVAQRKDNPQAALKRLIAAAVRDREEDAAEAAQAER